MRITSSKQTVPKNGSVTVTFGPFASGDVWESYRIEGAGICIDPGIAAPGGAGSQAVLSSRAGECSGKADADFRQSGQKACFYNIPGDVSHVCYVWQKISAGMAYIVVEATGLNFSSDVLVTISVAVRPAFRFNAGLKAKSKASMTVTSTQSHEL